MTKTILIVGGGAAGICAALGGAEMRKRMGSDVRIQLLERNPRLGIKILISGGGKCNITHAGPVESVLRDGFLKKNEQRFLKHAMYAFTNEDVLNLLTRQSVTWHARENGRIFPDSGRAEDVLQAFERELEVARIEVQRSVRVLGVAEKDGHWQIELPTGMLSADAVILTTGGVSYSKTGTTGDGIRYANILDHEIVPLRSALAPITLATKPAFELQGIALRNAELIVSQNGKAQTSKRGDVLITHNGLSGPATLDISRTARELLESGPISIACDLLGHPEEKLKAMLLELQQSRSSQQISTWLEEALPNRIVPYLLESADISQDRRWNALTKDERSSLLANLLRFPFGEVSDIPIERGEVTAGGVALSEVDSKTMMSRKTDGLFFAGEMLDIAGEIGGYNLQAAYSTGWLAGTSAIEFVSRQ